MVSRWRSSFTVYCPASPMARSNRWRVVGRRPDLVGSRRHAGHLRILHIPEETMMPGAAESTRGGRAHSGGSG